MRWFYNYPVVFYILWKFYTNHSKIPRMHKNDESSHVSSVPWSFLLPDPSNPASTERWTLSLPPRHRQLQFPWHWKTELPVSRSGPLQEIKSRKDIGDEEETLRRVGPCCKSLVRLIFSIAYGSVKAHSWSVFVFSGIMLYFWSVLTGSGKPKAISFSPVIHLRDTALGTYCPALPDCTQVDHFTHISLDQCGIFTLLFNQSPSVSLSLTDGHVTVYRLCISALNVLSHCSIHIWKMMTCVNKKSHQTSKIIERGQ